MRSALSCRAWAQVALLAASSGCGPKQDPSGGLRLLGFRQAQEQHVSINEELVFHFSDELDRTSVNAATVRILDPQGLPARGRLRVDRSSLHFEPDLPRQSDVSDGGLRANVAYVVELAGFPRPDGLRSRDQEPLVATLRLPFRTTDGSGPSPLFVDLFPPAPFPLTPLSERIGPLDPIVLVCGEAIDPRSLENEVLELFSLAAIEQGTIERGEGIPLSIRIVENRRDLCRIELVPVVRPGGARMPLETGTYVVRRTLEGLQNLVGRRIEIAWTGPRRMQIDVVAGDLRQEITQEVTSWQNPEHLPECSERFDGSAVGPPASGPLMIRFPRAAGSGVDGEVLLTEWNGELDLNATRLEVPSGVEVDLPGAGWIVLRSQGPIEVHGTLRRAAEQGSASKDSPLARELRALSFRSQEEWGELSRWLEHGRESGEPWTVLVAGGDLRISGTIEVHAPLMLMAGGWIHVSGRIDAQEIWKSPQGGDNLARVFDAPLRLDPPSENPLRRTLRMVAFSSTIRPQRTVLAWGPIDVQGDPGAGSFSVEFVGLRKASRAGAEERYGPVPELELLGGCQGLELVVILEVPPGRGEPWDPPRLDRIQLGCLASGRYPAEDERTP